MGGGEKQRNLGRASTGQSRIIETNSTNPTFWGEVDFGGGRVPAFFTVIFSTANNDKRYPYLRATKFDQETKVIVETIPPEDALFNET